MIVKGSKVNDRYEIIKTLGEGGMANVYLAYDTILDRNVAVKVLRGDLAGDEKFVRRFQREALSASSLSHPNIVEVYDVGEDNGQYYIVMEYVEGKTLKQLLKKREKLTITEVIDIMSQLTDGMAHAHDAYIIHRDIKPQNIMILENGTIKITDFGIAMALNAAQLTQTNSVMGSVHYLPPEQASGKGSTIRSDIYSMGILMYELLTGAIPYRGENAVEIALKHMKEPLPSIRTVLPDIPQSIENIILKSTAKNPQNRYKDAREMHEDIITAMDENRSNEKRYVYPYPESETDSSKKEVKEVPTVKKNNNVVDDDENFFDDDKETKTQKKILLILATIFTGLIVFAAVIIVLLPKLMTKKDVTIPSEIIGKSLVEASNMLTKLGFEVEEATDPVASETVEEGLVAKSVPQAGKIVKEGSKIVLYISSGEETFELENYSGKNYIEVKTILETKYDAIVLVENEEVSEENKDKYKEDTVIKTDPVAGTKLKRRATIKLYVPEVSIKYPDFTDGSYTLNDVEDFCKENELTLIIAYQEDDNQDEGIIVKQSRPGGTNVAKGSPFTITLTKHSEVNMSEDEFE